MRSTGSRLVGLALGVVVVLGLAGCGGDPEARPPTWFGSEASDARHAEAPAEEDARAFLVQVTDAQMAVESVTMDITMSVAGEDVVAHGQSRMGEDPTDVEMAMTMEMPGLGTMEMRFVDQVMYMSLGAESDGKFVAIDADDEMFGEDFALMLEQMDPSVQMELMKDAVLDFRQEGDPEQIDGVEAVPYVLELDFEAVMEGSGVPTDELPEGELPETVETTIFIGPDDLPRRMVMDTMGTQMTMDFSAWGAEVVIEAPAPDEILEGGLEELMSDVV